jgi:hypothetical protein
MVRKPDLFESNRGWLNVVYTLNIRENGRNAMLHGPEMNAYHSPIPFESGRVNALGFSTIENFDLPGILRIHADRVFGPYGSA